MAEIQDTVKKSDNDESSSTTNSQYETDSDNDESSSTTNIQYNETDSEDNDYQKWLKELEKNEQLYDAAEWGRLNDVIQLISEGADPSWNHPDWFGWTPLHVAKTAAVAEVLLMAQANVNAIDELGQTPLHVAKTAAVAKVLVKAQANVNAINKYGRTPLHFAKTAAVAEVLVKAQANVNAIDEWGRTPLHVAETAAVAEVLVKAQANVNAIDMDGQTPLHHAKTDAVAEVLVKAQANVNAIDEDGNSCLHTSSRCSDSSAVQYFISMISVVTLSNNGQTPLFMAVQNESFAEEVVSLLLKEGARADIIDNNGQCVLHYTWSPVVAEMVITAGAQIDTIDKERSGSKHCDNQLPFK